MRTENRARTSSPGRVMIAVAVVVTLSWLSCQQAVAEPPAYQVKLTMQAQEQSNWCWAAAGATIAVAIGHPIAQKKMCALSKGLNEDANCPNNQASLGEVQTGFRRMGLKDPGDYTSSVLPYATLRRLLAADQPVETRILWASGGGHMQVLYGYDDAKDWVFWGDPWPASPRLSSGPYSRYVKNNKFTWTHTLSGIEG